MDNIETIKETFADLTEKIADESGLAVVVVDENGTVFKANNNSICEVLEASDEFMPRCAEFCGRAFQMASESNETVSYQCYAGLDCLAVPLDRTKSLVAIVGRTFTKAENYRKATERAISGDWNKFPPTRVFENVLLSGSSKVLETTAKYSSAVNVEACPVFKILYECIVIFWFYHFNIFILNIFHKFISD